MFRVYDQSRAAGVFGTTVEQCYTINYSAGEQQKKTAFPDRLIELSIIKEVRCVIKHVVMWKLKDFAEGADKARNAKRLKIELEALKNTIPQIVQLEVGINILASDAAYDVVLYSVFRNAQDLDLYQNHPNHRAVADFAGKVRESRVVADYRTD